MLQVQAVRALALVQWLEPEWLLVKLGEALGVYPGGLQSGGLQSRATDFAREQADACP